MFCAQMVAYLFGEETGLFPRKGSLDDLMQQVFGRCGNGFRRDCQMVVWGLDGIPAVRFEFTEIL